MTDNLLSRPGFEGDEKSGEWYVHPSGCGKLPTGWKPYFSEERTEPWQNARPEYGHPERLDPQWEYRRRSGDKSFGYGSDWHTHKGGAYLQVHQEGLTGQTVRFSVWGYYLVGGTGSENLEHPGLIRDRVGIDPQGLEPVDPLGHFQIGDQVVWNPAQIENLVRGFETVPEWKLHTVEAKAESDTITLYLYTEPEWAGIRTSGPNWDDVTLEIVAGTGYESTMLVLPQDATIEQLFEVARLAFKQKRTYGFSYDDAGRVADHAILYNILDADRADFDMFFAERYPGCKISYAYTSDWIDPGSGTAWDEYLLWQKDPEWRDVRFGPGGCTMGGNACFVTSIAMAQRIYGIDDQATPLTVKAKVGPAGFASPCNLKWSAISDHLGMTLRKDVTDDQIRSHLAGGGVALLEVEPPGMEHWVLAVARMGDDDFLVMDPLTNTVGSLKANYTGWEQWRMVSKKVDPPPPPPAKPMVPGLHLQTRVEWDVEYYQAARPPVVKLFSYEDARRFVGANPDVKVDVRYFTNNQNPGEGIAVPSRRIVVPSQKPFVAGDLSELSIAGLMGKLEEARMVTQYRARTARVARAASPIGLVRNAIGRRLARGPAKAAADYILTFIDSLQMHHEFVDWAEGFNELIGSSDREFNRLVIEFETAFAYKLAEYGLKTRGCLLNVAVGNPHVEWVVDMLPAARAAVATGGVIGYHAYWWANQQTDGLLSWFEWHAGRWIKWAEEWRKYGVEPHFLLTECGAVGSAEGRHLLPNSGWRSKSCLAGDLDRFAGQIGQMRQLIEGNNRIWGNCEGWMLFTSGADYTNWGSWQVRKPQMQRFA